jgi:hypothetical protein
MLLVVPAIAAASKPKPNPADFPLTAHTLFSSLQPMEGRAYGFDLDVTINGQEMDLFCYGAGPEDLLPVVDYPAKLDPPDKSAKFSAAPAPHYTLLMPNGTTLDFVVRRMGRPPAQQ